MLISHEHPDHCADLNPLLRARVLRDDPPPPLPVHALPGALDAVLELDRPGMLASGHMLHELTADSSLDIGRLQVQTRLLPHWLPNAGIRLAAGGRVLACTGDTGPSHDVADLARGADLLLAEASYVNQMPVAAVGTRRTGCLPGPSALLRGSGASRRMPGFVETTGPR